jgi:hypothetical protein
MPRNWRKTQSYRDWRASVLEMFNQECAITGQKNQKPKDLAVHHMYGAKPHPDLRYVVENGIPLWAPIHDTFHILFTYQNNTLPQFQVFLEMLLENPNKLSLLISSQANSKGLEGSETRAYDPARIMKLQERLETMLQILESENCL